MSEWRSARISLLEAHDPAAARLVARLLTVAQRTLRRSYLGDEFAFTLRGDELAAEGTSTRYGAIASLGLAHLPDPAQRAILVGEDSDDLLGRLAKGLDRMTDRGDVALICLAAAETGHSELPHAIDRLAELDRRLLSGQPGDAIDVVAAAWVVTALVAARAAIDVEPYLAAARQRLLGARRVVFPHQIGGPQKWYRAHVGSFADQIYPVQALARLHASADDPAALEAAEQVARVICQAQGPAGQWWWHYDARSGAVVEGYPVYSVHQHAMAPMGLLDLAEAGGEDHLARDRARAALDGRAAGDARAADRRREAGDLAQGRPQRPAQAGAGPGGGPQRGAAGHVDAGRRPAVPGRDGGLRVPPVRTRLAALRLAERGRRGRSC